MVSVGTITPKSTISSAVKIEPEYSHGVFYVQDASKSVGVASALLSTTLKPQLLADTKADYETVRQRRANKGKSKLISLEKARANKPNISFNTIQPHLLKYRGICQPTPKCGKMAPSQ
jgi:5-methyltetrahydrofolate--homocysteine methyltransferase